MLWCMDGRVCVVTSFAVPHAWLPYFVLDLFQCCACVCPRQWFVVW